MTSTATAARVPFARMTLRLTAPYRTSEDYTWWSSERLPILGGAPPRARVIVDDAIHAEKGVTNEAGRYKSTLLLTTKYAFGRVITFKVTKRGWIGAHWEIKILNRSPGYETRRILCIPPSGGSSKDCRQVSRGS